METSLTRLLNLSTPIVQAPMGELDGPALAAAVSNAGALGMLGLSWTPPGEIPALIEATRSVTDRPFGINLILDWGQEERLARALDLGVPLVSFFWGDPAPFLPRVHGAGALAMITVGSAAQAAQAVEAGIDVIVAQGVESGGQVYGQVGTLALVPAVVDRAGPTPVVAAGGIADGRGLAAALALGAAGAMCGTRFLASEEAIAHPAYKERLVAARETETHHGTLFDGGWRNAPHRTLTNGAVERWLAAGRPEAGARPEEGRQVGRLGDGTAITLYQDVPVDQGVEGDWDRLPLYAGQSAGLIQAIKPASQIVAEMTAEAEAILG